MSNQWFTATVISMYSSSLVSSHLYILFYNKTFIYILCTQNDRGGGGGW